MPMNFTDSHNTKLWSRVTIDIIFENRLLTLIIFQRNARILQNFKLCDLESIYKIAKFKSSKNFYAMRQVIMIVLGKHFAMLSRQCIHVYVQVD